MRSQRQGWGQSGGTALKTELSITRRRGPVQDCTSNPALALPDLPTLTNLLWGHGAAAALSYGIKCLENRLLSRRRGENLPQPFALPGMEVSGAEWINPNNEACYAEKAKPSFPAPKTSTYRGKISQVLTPRAEVLHLPVIQTIHLRGVDSLRAVYFLSLLFPSFASAAWSLPPALTQSLRWETGDGCNPESNAVTS